jgi:TonB-dependent receptor
MNRIPQVSLPAGVLRRFIVCLIALSLNFATAWAQAGTGSLDGKVIDAGKELPLAGAIVEVDGTLFQTSTDRAGEFYFASLPAGAHKVRVSYLGMDPQEFAVTVVADQRATLDAKLGDQVVRLSTFQVEGQRVGQARALNQERASDNLKNIVAADAMGRFADQNAAESLARISGISLERDQGEGRFVLVRGIDPNLNMTMINGVVVPSSEGNERTINLDVIPSDVLSSIEVSKSNTPDMEGGAIGGTVDLHTQSAFDEKNRVLAGSVSLQYNRLRDEVASGKADIRYADQFRNRTIGLVLAASYQRRDFSTLNVEASKPALTNSPTGGQFYLPSKYTLKDYHPIRDRAGLNAALEFKPNADNYLYVRAFYSYFSDDENDGDVILPTGKGVVSALSADQAAVTVNKSNIKSKSRKQTSDLASLAVGGEHTRNDLHWDWMGSFAYGAEETPFQIEASFLNSKNDTTTVSIDSSDIYRPVVRQTAFTNKGDLSSPAGYFLDNFEVEVKQAHENQWAFVANVQKDAMIAGNPGFWKTGIKYRIASKHYDKNDYEYGDTSLAYATFADRSSYPYFRPADQDFLTFKWDEMKSYFKTHGGEFTLKGEDTAIAAFADDFDSDENVLAGYVMGKVKTGKSTWLAGVRVEETFFKTIGFESNFDDSGAFTGASRVSASRDYASVLPSINYHYDFTDRLVFRASATRSLSRPKLEDSAFRRSVDRSVEEVTEGNPELKPYQATNLDASLNYYMPHLGLVSAGIFYKDISDFIFTQSVGGGDAATGFDLITPENGDRATISGLELGWQQQLTFLPAPFDGFNIYANATFTDSDSTIGGDSGRAGESFPFVSQSKTIANVALSYEKRGLLVRLAGNYRSSSLTEIGGSAIEDLYTASHFQLDLTSRYQFTSKCSVFLNVTNLNNAPYRVYFGTANTLAQSEYYRYAVDAGIQYRF